MKTILQFLFFFSITVCFAQAPVVNNPTLNVAADNSLNISCVINPNGTVSSYEVIYSEDGFFTPNVTHSFNVSTSLTGSTSQTVTTDILCLNSADNYYVKVRATNANGTTTSGYTTMVTTGNTFNNLPKVNTLNFSNITTTSATLNVNVDNNSNLSTTAYVEYGLSTTNLAFYSALPTTSTDNAIASVNLSGLSANTTYYFRISLSNSVGCTKSAFYQLTTPMPVTLLYHFPFNGNRDAVVGTGTFTSGAGFATFVDNGLGNSTGAIEIAGGPTSLHNQTANLSSLPQGTTSRSIAMRISFRNASMDHYVVSWGSATNFQSYGFEKSPSQAKSAIWGNNIAMNNSTSTNSWHIMVITFDGNTGYAKYYFDGTLIGGGYHNLASMNTNGTNIVLGRSLSPSFGASNFHLDDLKIYSGVLSDSQVTTLSSSDFNRENLSFKVFPNPANDILNIDMESDIKSIEIYSLLGQKVKVSNNKQTDISNLSNGVYMVRVEDVNGAVSTQKLIKK